MKHKHKPNNCHKRGRKRKKAACGEESCVGCRNDKCATWPKKMAGRWEVGVNHLPTVVLTRVGKFGGSYMVKWAGHLIGYVEKTCDTSGSATTWSYTTWDGKTQDCHDTRAFALQCLLHAVEERDSK